MTGGVTPLHYVAARSHEAVVQRFIDQGTGIDPVNNKSQTPLHLVCRIGGRSFPNVLQLLLEANADINAKDSRGCTPLRTMSRHPNSHPLASGFQVQSVWPVAPKALLTEGARAHHLRSQRSDGSGIVQRFLWRGAKSPLSKDP